MVAPVIDSPLELIGKTPLIRLNRVVGDTGATVWAKAEQMNPGGSVKDRICLAMIEAAERAGLIHKGTTIVEPTSGNTGIGLALVCAIKGYKLVLTMPESMSLERRALLAAYGAKIVLTPAEQVMEGAIAAAREIVEVDGAFMPMQFENPANPETHRAHTAPEILEALRGTRIDAFVAAVGTGGTISGVGARLKEHDSKVRVIAVEPESSAVLSGGEAGPTKIQGIGAGFVPRNFQRDVVDEIRQVSDRAAYDMKVRLAREEGLLVGISAGANVVAAAAVAAELGSGATIVTVLCDTGERYFSLDEYFKNDSGSANKRVLLIGAGGLGTPVASVLARSGVGHLEVADDDVVELSNLHRQLLYTAADVGESKATRACRRIEQEAAAAAIGCNDQRQSPLTAVAREMRVVPDNARDIVRDFDMVVEGADNFSTKFLIADACALENIACVQAGAVRWTGWALASIPGESACLRCVFEDIPEGPAQGCSEAGVIGPVVGVVGALQAALALRVLRGERAAAGVLQHYRALTGVLRSRSIARSSSCPTCTGQIHELNATRYVPRECAA